MTKKEENKTVAPGTDPSNMIGQATELPRKVIEEGVKISTTVATAPGKIMGAVAVAPYAGMGDQAVGVFNGLDSDKTGQAMQAMGQLGNTSQRPAIAASNQQGITPRPHPVSSVDEDDENKKKPGFTK